MVLGFEVLKDVRGEGGKVKAGDIVWAVVGMERVWTKDRILNTWLPDFLVNLVRQFRVKMMTPNELKMRRLEPPRYPGRPFPRMRRVARDQAAISRKSFRRFGEANSNSVPPNSAS